MRKSRVVLDTNIFINGWFFIEDHPDCSQIMDMIENRKFNLLFAQDTIGELLYVAKNYARYNIDDITDRIVLLQEIAKLFYYSTSVNTMKTEVESSNDKYDDMFLKCALEGNADYFVSDDFKHGLHDREFDKLIVVSSSDFVKLMNEE